MKTAARRVSKKKSRKASKRPAMRKTRRSGRSGSGPQSIVHFVKQKGTRGATSSEIVQHWDSQGRAKGVYGAIGKLVREKKLKKHAMEGRGSRYTAP